MVVIYLSHCIGEYHQYDNMAYPYIKPDGMITRAVKLVTFGKWRSSDDKIVVPDHNSMQYHSLKIYLERYANDLSTCKISNMAVVTDEIMHIYQSLKDPYAMSDPVLRNDPSIWRANDLPKVKFVILLIVGTEIIY